jgi:hypothetical protein
VFVSCGRVFEYALGQCLPVRGPRDIRGPLNIVRSSVKNRGMNE